MSTLSQFFGGGIKSIQRFTASASSGTSTTTITSVDTTKTMLNFLGCSADDNAVTTSVASGARISLTNATTVTATYPNSSSSYTASVSFEVIEYF